MSWFSGWRLGKSRPLDARLLRLGRYSDAYKSSEQLAAWERSMSYFAEGNYSRSFLHFLQYLRDPVEQNIHWVADQKGRLSFELLQGSRRISGSLGQPYCEAITTIGVCRSCSESLLRELLEVNDKLQYCRYGLQQDGQIVLRWSATAAESDPYRLFFSLRELAVQADKIDDLLIRQNKDVQPVYEPHIQEYPEGENQIRVKWLRTKVHQLMSWYAQDRSLHQRYPGGMNYAILAFLYKIEFLLCPQGPLREAIEQAHRTYFQAGSGNMQERMERLLAIMESAVARPDKELYGEFYKVVTTFGLVQPISFHRLTTQIEGELAQIDAYDQADTRSYVPHISSFLIGYGLFNYALPGFIRDLYALYYYMEEESLLFSLGMPPFLEGETRYRAKDKLVQTIRELQATWADRITVEHLYPEQIDLSDPVALARTYLKMIVTMKIREN